jgi:hypothetical protein
MTHGVARAGLARTGLVAVLLLLTAAPACAGGLSLGWTDCLGEGGASNSAFACNTNLGTHVLTSSFVLDADLARVSGNELVFDLLSESDPLPSWWEFREPGSCRLTSLSLSTAVDPANVLCTDWAAGSAAGGIAYYGSELGSGDPSLVDRHRRLKVAVAVPSTGLIDLSADVEYFSCNLVINHAKSAGAGACAGCDVRVCIVLASLDVTTPDAQDHVWLEEPVTAGGNIATWQGVGPDCLLVPTRNTTWGAIKSRFR